MTGLELFAVEADGPRRLVAPDTDDVHAALAGAPHGVYSALRTYRGHHYLRLEDHLARTQRSADRLGWETVLDEDALRRALDATARGRPGDERVRFDLLPAPATALGTDSRLLIVLAPFAPLPAAFREEGVGVEVTGEVQRDDPLTKDASWIDARRPWLRGTQESFDALLVDADGNVSEASSANAFAVADGVLWTPDDGILEGVTRRVVLELARAEGVPVRLAPLPRAALAEVDELFLTSSSRHVLPAVRVAGRPVGDGRPGPVTRRLAAAYDAYAEAEARPATPD